MPSLIAKLLAGSKPDRATGQWERDWNWTLEDIALEVASGRLTIDATERVTTNPNRPPVSLAEAYAGCLPLLMSTSSAFTPGVGPQPEAVQDLLIALVKDGHLSSDEHNKVAMRALTGGADRAFLSLSSHWAPADRLALLTHPGQASIKGYKVSFAHAALHAGLHRVVRALLADGWDINDVSPDGLGLGHLVCSPEILPDLQAKGLDPLLLDKKGRTGPGFWPSAGLPAAQQKRLATAWAAVFAGKLDSETAHLAAVRTLLSDLGKKSKGLLLTHLKAASLAASDLVEGRPLVEHAARNLLLNPSSVASTSSTPLFEYLLDHSRATGGALLNQIWQLRVACRFNLPNAANTDFERRFEEVDGRIALEGVPRLEAIAQAIDGLCEGADRHKAWVNVESWTLLRHTWDKMDDDDSRTRRVTDKQWLSWLSVEQEDGRSRIMGLCEGVETAPKLGINFFSRRAKFTHPQLPLPGKETDWLMFSFRCLCAQGTRPRARTPGMFPGELVLPDFTAPAADVFDRLWNQGVRPDAAQTQQLCQWARQYQPGALPVFENYLMEMTTAPAARTTPRGPRL